MYLGPGLAQVGDDSTDFFPCTSSTILIRRPQAGAEQLFITKDIQRQIAEMTIVTLKEFTFLIAVYGIIRGIHIEYYLAGRRLV